MKPEQLKVIALGMGYKIHSIHDDIVFISHAGFRVNGFPYQPDTTNNDQMVEIMERLKFKLEFSGESWDAELEKPFIYCLGKTINEAVCNAAFAFFDEKTN